MLACSTAAEEQLLDAEALLDDRHIPAALARFDAAQIAGADPDRCSAGRWMCHMLTGEFAAAWNESDAIRARGAPDLHRLWNGEDIRGARVIVRCLHGLGDAVQMLRYAPRLKELCAELIVEVPPALLDLALRFDGVDCAITWGESAPATAPRWDIQVEVTELPYLFRTTIVDLPIADRYIQLREWAIPAPLAGRGSVPRVGVVWAAGDWNPARSISLPDLSRMFETERAEFWNLQGGASANDWSLLKREANLRDGRGLTDGIERLAAVISRMDLVITVDTLAAHLAGGLGVPAWVLLQYSADWRWMMNRCTSPWYPSMRLFRQHRAGRWHEVVECVQNELVAWTAQFNNGAATSPNR